MTLILTVNCLRPSKHLTAHSPSQQQRPATVCLELWEHRPPLQSSPQFTRLHISSHLADRAPYFRRLWLVTCWQSRTGGVLGAVPSAAVMGARRIFFPGGGQIHGCKKVDDLFLVVTLKTQVFTVTTNAQNTLQHFQGASALKTFHFYF